MMDEIIHSLLILKRTREYSSRILTRFFIIVLMCMLYRVTNSGWQSFVYFNCLAIMVHPIGSAERTLTTFLMMRDTWLSLTYISLMAHWFVYLLFLTTINAIPISPHLNLCMAIGTYTFWLVYRLPNSPLYFMIGLATCFTNLKQCDYLFVILVGMFSNMHTDLIFDDNVAATRHSKNDGLMDVTDGTMMIISPFILQMIDLLLGRFETPTLYMVIITFTVLSQVHIFTRYTKSVHIPSPVIYVLLTMVRTGWGCLMMNDVPSFYIAASTLGILGWIICMTMDRPSFLFNESVRFTNHWFSLFVVAEFIYTCNFSRGIDETLIWFMMNIGNYSAIMMIKEVLVSEEPMSSLDRFPVLSSLFAVCFATCMCYIANQERFITYSFMSCFVFASAKLVWTLVHYMRQHLDAVDFYGNVLDIMFLFYTFTYFTYFGLCRPTFFVFYCIMWIRSALRASQAFITNLQRKHRHSVSIAMLTEISDHTNCDQCPICWSKTNMVKTECNHIYCRGCITEWASSSNNNRRCPLCRRELQVTQSDVHASIQEGIRKLNIPMSMFGQLEFEASIDAAVREQNNYD
jgi:hypothetical protein